MVTLLKVEYRFTKVHNAQFLVSIIVIHFYSFVPKEAIQWLLMNAEHRRLHAESQHLWQQLCV